jgi:hypothetical protein
VKTFTPEQKRKAPVTRGSFVLGSRQGVRTFGQRTILGAGL